MRVAHMFICFVLLAIAQIWDHMQESQQQRASFWEVNTFMLLDSLVPKYRYLRRSRWCFFMRQVLSDGVHLSGCCFNRSVFCTRNRRPYSSGRPLRTPRRLIFLRACCTFLRRNRSIVSLSALYKVLRIVESPCFKSKFNPEGFQCFLCGTFFCADC